MNLINMASILLAQQDVTPSQPSAGFELAIWKWVVFIGVGAFVVIFALRRISDIIARKRTENMIESVVGQGESNKNTEWVEEEDEDDDEKDDEKDRP